MPTERRLKLQRAACNSSSDMKVTKKANVSREHDVAHFAQMLIHNLFVAYWVYRNVNLQHFILGCFHPLICPRSPWANALLVFKMFQWNIDRLHLQWLSRDFFFFLFCFFFSLLPSCHSIWLHSWLDPKKRWQSKWKSISAWRRFVHPTAWWGLNREPSHLIKCTLHTWSACSVTQLVYLLALFPLDCTHKFHSSEQPVTSCVSASLCLYIPRGHLLAAMKNVMKQSSFFFFPGNPCV